MFSDDDHMIEPADVWSSRVPARFMETFPLEHAADALPAKAGRRVLAKAVVCV